MKPIFRWTSLCAALFLLMEAQGQTIEEAPYRYLIVADASASMMRDKDVAADATGRLLLGGFNGRVQTGDMVGLWTFAEQVNQNACPPTMWAAETRAETSDKAARVLRDMKYAKSANLSEVVSRIKETAKRSGALEVFLVTDGTTPIQGTPFDTQINAVFQQHAASMKKVKKPFIVVLSARNGELVAHAISPGGNRVFIPPVPKPPAIPVTDEDVFGIERPAGTNGIAQVATNTSRGGATTVKTNTAKTLSVSEISEILRKQQADRSDALAAAAAAAAASQVSNVTRAAAAADSSRVTSNAPTPPESAAAPQRIPTDVGEPASSPGGAKTASVADGGAKPIVEHPAERAPQKLPETAAIDEPRKAESPHATAGAHDDSSRPVEETATIVPPSIQASGRRYLLIAAGFFGLAVVLSWVLVRWRRSRVYPSLITRSLRERERH